MLGLAASLQRGGASLLTFVKDNLKLYLDFKSNKSDTLKFPSEGSTFFDGSDDFIDCGNNSSLQFSGSFSIGCWFKTTDATATNEILVSQANDGTNDSWLIRLNSSRKLEFEIYRGGSILITDSGSASNDGNWHHVVAVHESGIGNKLYKNGSLVASNSTGTDLTEHVPNFHIGNQDHSTARAINADICNVFAYSRALTPEEIQSIQNKSYSQLKGVEKTSLVMWQSLDSASDGVVQPATGETLGTNLFTDSTFDLSGTQSASTTGTHWTTGSAWTIANGEAIYDATAHENRLELPSATFQNAGLYKFSFTVSDANTKAGIKIKAGGNDIIPTAYYDNGSHVIYYNQASAYGSAKTLKIEGRNDVHGAFKLQSASWELVTSNTGFVTGAITTTSVYGGNAPILPRAVDVAKEGQADNIGNGSALFNGSTDHVELGGSSPDSAFSITAWVFDTHASGSDFSAIYASNSTAIWFGVKNNSSGLVRLHINGDGNYADTPSGSFSSPSNEWIHLACTWDGTNAKIYINGISQTLSVTGTLANPTANANPTIGINDNNLSVNQWTGSISQVGLWQGALTQSQVQEVLESTSYQNIPSSVKSTLGAETLTHDFSDGTGVTVPSSLSSLTTFNGEMVVNGGSVGSDYYLIGDNVTWDTSKVYKIVVVCSAYTSGGLTHQGGSATFGTNFGISSSIGGVGTFTNYAVPNQDGIITLRSQSFVGTLSSISIKEVINDLVAYYPLDGDSSRGNGTDDVTTGEVLGSEIASNNFGGWTLNGWTDNGDETASANNSSGGNQNLTLSYSFTASTLYKVTTTFSNISGNFYYSMDGTGGLDKTITTNGEQILYVKTSGSGASSFFIRSSNGSSATISNVSIKEVTSNTGVLK